MFFCHFEADKRLPIMTTPGVASVVGFGGAPAEIDDREIESLQTLVASGLPCSPWPFLQSGQRIRVHAGPLCGAEGIVLKVKDEYRLVCSVSLLQRSVAVEIEQDFVTPL